MPANDPMPGWRCHALGCPREREGYSWWCIGHKDAAHPPTARCPCHGVMPPGIRQHAVYTGDPLRLFPFTSDYRRTG